MKNKKTIVHLTYEVAPFYKRGGLGDVAGSLPCYLAEACDNYVISFYYQGRMNGLEQAEKSTMLIPIHGIDYSFHCYTLTKGKVTFYFIDLEDENIFCDSEGGNHPDSKGSGKAAYIEALPMMTYFYFAKAALCLIKQEGLSPTSILLHDWHVCGIFAYENLLDQFRKAKACKTLLMIHNYEHQGELLPDSFRFMDEESRTVVGQLYEKYQSASLLGLAIEKSDFVGTVSKGYASELMNGQAPHSGYKYLHQRFDRVLDFTNGVDYSEWHPQNSPYLDLPYGWETLDRKSFHKHRVLKKCGFADDGRPLGLLMARLTPQKGTYLFMNPENSDTAALQQLKKLLDTGMRIIIYGNPSGGKNSRTHQLFSLARQHFPEQFYYDSEYNEPKAHQYLAGADVLLSPSFFEPCGLVQLYAMAFGTVPLVNPVGGLGQTVNCYRNSTVGATGFHMENYTMESLRDCMKNAVEIYDAQPRIWQQLIKEGMASDFSWGKMIQKYLDFFAAQVAVHV